MRLSPQGRIVQAAWEDLPRHYQHVVLDAFCVMPNHVHGIIVLVDDGSGHGRGGSVQAENPPPQITPSGPEPLPDPDQTRPYNEPIPDHRTGGSVQAENPPPQITPSGPEPLPDPDQTRPYPHPARHGLPEIVRAFKSFSARRINALRRMKGVSVWQRNYYEHIIRNKTEFERIADCIVNNPQKWEADQLHPSAPPNKFNQG